jgi:hypothetical protein
LTSDELRPTEVFWADTPDFDAGGALLDIPAGRNLLGGRAADQEATSTDHRLLA